MKVHNLTSGKVLEVWLFGIVVGMVLGVCLAILFNVGVFDAYRCTEYSPVTGKCVVFTDQQERSRYAGGRYHD